MVCVTAQPGIETSQPPLVRAVTRRAGAC